MPLLKDLITIPERVHQGDFVLKLSEGVSHAEQTLRENPRGGVDDAPGRDRPSKTAAKKRGTRAERVSAGASLAFGGNVPTLEQALGQITTLQQEMAVLRAQIEWFKDL